MLSRLKGISLVELMISMALGIILSGACIQTFLTMKQLFIKLNAIARIQENARAISVVMGESLESAGALGCNAFEHNHVIYYEGFNPKSMLLLPRSRVLGVDLASMEQESVLSKRILARIKPENDIIAIKTVQNWQHVEKVDAKEHQIVLDGFVKIPKDRIICLSDCAKSVCMRIKEVQHRASKTIIRLNSQSNFFERFVFSKNVLYGELAIQVFYIGRTNRTSISGNPIDALYMTDINGRTLELVEGLEKMKIEYGVSDGNTLHYVNQDAVKDWLSVRKCRVTLLLNSIEDTLHLNQDAAKENRLQQWWQFEWQIKSYA
ncbi:MAG: PilW family protein [Candidatus Berkiella sp.]